MVEAFRANNWSDPCHGESTHEDNNLRLQYRSYTNNNPPTKHQKVLTPSFYCQLFHISTSKQSTALSLLCISAFFWARCSCEHSWAPTEQKPNLYLSKKVHFLSITRKLSHNNPNLINADQVTWIFEDQKNNEKNVSISQDNNNDPLVNPVRALAQTAQHILSILAPPKNLPSAPIYSLQIHPKRYS